MKRQLTQLVVVADYGDGLAWGELELALEDAFPGVFRTFLNVPPFNTVAAGFGAAQLARRKFRDPRRIAFLVNADPREQTAAPLPDGAGAPLLCVTLDNGVRVFGPNAGFSLSFLKRRIKALAALSDGTGAGQFRSRDQFPGLMAAALRKNGAGLGTRLPVDAIPDFRPDGVVALWVDGYGNVKTSLTRSQAERQGWKPDKELTLLLGGPGADYPRKVWCSTSIMGVASGTFVLAPGSSGDPQDPYMEFAVRYNREGPQDSAARRLGCAQPGEPLKIAFPLASQAERLLSA